MPEYSITYDSIGHLAKDAKWAVTSGTFRDTRNGDFHDGYDDFAEIGTWREAESLSVNGWDEEAVTALDIAESVIDSVAQEHNLPAFTAVWDTSGCEVDVARYLSGEPENMIDYEPVPTPRHGRVIVLCASVAASGAVSRDAFKRRGYTIAALAFALSRIGYAVELWADCSVELGNSKARMRILVKGANDELDPARIMFAYSHPGMLRAVCLPALHAVKGYNRLLGARYGSPIDPKHDLPEGTLYLPCLCTDYDVPDADRALAQYMRDLGILAE